MSYSIPIGLDPTSTLYAIDAANSRYILPLANATLGANLVPSGYLVVIPFVITAAIQITLAQLSMTQDYSLRTWVSQYPNGIPIVGYFPILKMGGLPIVVYTATQILPVNTNLVPVNAGSYVLNIFNLTNEPNIFSLKLALL